MHLRRKDIVHFIVEQVTTFLAHSDELSYLIVFFFQSYRHTASLLLKPAGRIHAQLPKQKWPVLDTPAHPRACCDKRLFFRRFFVGACARAAEAHTASPTTSYMMLDGGSTFHPKPYEYITYRGLGQSKAVTYWPAKSFCNSNRRVIIRRSSAAGGFDSSCFCNSASSCSRRRLCRTPKQLWASSQVCSEKDSKKISNRTRLSRSSNASAKVDGSADSPAFAISNSNIFSVSRPRCSPEETISWASFSRNPLASASICIRRRSAPFTLGPRSSALGFTSPRRSVAARRSASRKTGSSTCNSEAIRVAHSERSSRFGKRCTNGIKKLRADTRPSAVVRSMSLARPIK